MLGRERTKRTLVFLDQYLSKLKQNYRSKFGKDLRFVLFSDHGFQYTTLKTVSNSALKNALKNVGLNESELRLSGLERHEVLRMEDVRSVSWC
jgi:hypothetical protein